MKPKNRATHLVLLQRVSTGLLWLETRRENDALVLLSAGQESFTLPESEDAPPLSGADQLKAALRAIGSHLKLGWMARHEVIVIAPSHHLTARFLDTPPVEEDTLGDLVAFEVSEALQVPIHDVAWDMLLSSKHGEDAKKKLLWIAARKAYIDDLLSGWPDDRLSPTQITPDFWGYYEFLLATQETCLFEPAILISRDGDRASISIADCQAIYLTRSVTLKRPVRPDDAIDESDAEEYALALEIERTLYYAADRTSPAAPKSMICCGFEDWKFDRMQMVADGNGLRLSHLTQSDVLSFYQSKIETVQPAHLPMLCIAYCQLRCDVIGPNLLDIEEEPMDWKSFIPEAALPSRKFMTIGGALFAAFFVLWIGKGIWFNQAIQTRLNRGGDMIKLANRLQKEEIGLRQLARNDVNYAEMFLYLADNLPDGILVKNLSIDIKTGVELSFVGGNNQQALELQKKLNESPYFREVVLDRSAIEKEGFSIFMKGKLQPSR